MPRLTMLLLAGLLLTGCKVDVGYDDEANAKTKADAGAPAAAAPQTLVDPASADESATASVAAAAFLERVDADDVAATWASASPSLKQSVAEATWNTGISGLRAAAGDLESRHFTTVGVSDAVPDAPPGHYAFVFYRTDFARAKDVEEKVVLHWHDGAWKVAGYHLSARAGQAAQQP
jgi:hypothetical protein